MRAYRAKNGQKIMCSDYLFDNSCKDFLLSSILHKEMPTLGFATFADRKQASLTLTRPTEFPKYYFLMVRSTRALPLFPLPLLHCRCHCKLNRHTLVPLQAVLLYQLPTLFLFKVNLLVAHLDASKSLPSSPYSPRLLCF